MKDLLLKKWWILTGLILTFPFFSSGQEVPFKKLDVASGLSQNTITCIFKDVFGFIWLGTQDGLNRYDGQEIKTYRVTPTGENDPSSNYIVSITATTNGLLLLTKSGLFRYQYQEDVLEMIEGTNRFAASEKTGKLFSFEPGIQWLVYASSIWKLENHTYSKTWKNIQQAHPSTIFRETSSLLFHKDTLYFGQPGKIIMLNPKGDLLGEIPAPNPFSYLVLLKYENREIWMYTRQEVMVYHLDLQTWKTLYETTGDTIITTLEMPGKERIWIGTNFGIIEVNGKKSPGKTSKFWHKNYINTIADFGGYVFIGSIGEGLRIYHNEFELFRPFGPGENAAMEIWGFYEDEKHYYALGKEKIYPYSKQWKPLPEQHILKNNAVITSLWKMQDGTLYMGSNKDLYVQKNGSFIPFTHPEWSPKPVFQLTGNASHMYIATPSGVYIMGKDQQIRGISTRKNTQHYMQDYVMGMEIISADTIMLSESQGIGLWNTENDHIKILYPLKPVQGGLIPTSTITRPSGDIWFSTLGKGLYFYQHATGKVTLYDKSSGLLNISLYGLQEDLYGRIWMSSNEGISAFDLKDSTFYNFTTKDGLNYNECNQNAFYTFSSGEIAFGNPQGFTVINPALFSPDTLVPKVIIKNILVNYKTPDSSFFKQLKGPVHHPEKIEIYPKNRAVIFNFSILDYLHAEQCTLYYQLEGFDETWIMAPSGEPSATYTNLPHGRYTFRVKIKNRHGLEKEDVLTFVLDVRPPFWKTTWFIVCMILLSGGLGFFSIRFYYAQQLKKQRRKLEMQAQIEQERNRISKELHDNVGANLSYIATALDHTSTTETFSWENIKEEMEELAGFTRETITKLREAIWVLHKDKISLQELTWQINTFIQKQSLDDAEITLYCPDGTLELHPQQAINLLRILQEGLHNAWKYAEATEIKLEFLVREEKLVCTLRDNGKGFQEINITPHQHFGIQNMKDRASEIGGYLTIESAPGKGTLILFEMHL